MTRGALPPSNGPGNAGAAVAVAAAAAASIPITAAHFVPGSILPEGSVLTGRLSMVWGKLLPKLDSASTSSQIQFASAQRPRIAFNVVAKLDADVRLSHVHNDYTLPAPAAPPGAGAGVGAGRTKTYNIKINLYALPFPSSSTSTAHAGQNALPESVIENMEEDKTKLQKMPGATISVPCVGLEVLRMVDRGRAVDVELSGQGQREVRCKDQSIVILAPIHNDSTPAWLNSSAPAVSSPPPSTHSPVVLRNESSSSITITRLRPISTIPVPLFPQKSLASASASTSTNIPTTAIDASKTVSLDHDLATSTSIAASAEYKGKRRARSFSASADHDASAEIVDADTDTEMAPPIKRPRVSLPDISQPSSSNGDIPMPQSSEPEPEPEPRNVIQLKPVMRDRDVFTAPSPLLRTPPPPPARTSIPRSSSGISDASSPFTHRTGPASASSSRRVSFPSRTPSKELDENVRRGSEEDAMRVKRKEAETMARQRGEIAQAESSRAAQQRAQGVNLLQQGVDLSGMAYMPLHHLTAGTKANVIGVVVTVKPPKQVHSGDWIMNIVITDPTRYGHDAVASEDFVVTLFRSRAEQLPDFTTLRPGTVMLFRGLSISIFNEKTKGQAFTPRHEGENTWATLENGKVKLANPRDMYPPLSKPEVERMLAMRQWWNEHGDGDGAGAEGSVNGRASVTPSRRSSSGVPKDHVLLGQVRPSEFFDPTFRIMHIVPNPRNTAFELYVSDGTRSTLPLRNYHGVTEGLPHDAIFALAVKDDPPRDILPYFQKGNTLRMSNVRSKMYQGQMEMIWSELPTSDQMMAGWKRRRCQLIPDNDEKAIMIGRRIEALKNGQEPPLEDAPSVPVDDIPDGHDHPETSVINTDLPVPIATHLCTTFTDPINHPVSTISQILGNATIPNNYRTYCRHCKRAFRDQWCRSCNDTEGKEAEWRYRFIAIIEDHTGEAELGVLIADDEAAEFLPPLPPYSASSNPNDIKKTDERRKQLTNQAKTTLLGVSMNGNRVRPIIDMALEVYHVAKPGPGSSTGAGSGSGEKVLVARMFGMKGV